MSMHFARVAFGGALLTITLGAGPVFAADAKQVADAMVAALTANGEAKASYADATADGDTVTITEFKSSDASGKSSLTVPEIVITGAEARDKGGFTASEVSLDNGSLLADDNTITWKGASISDAVIPSPEEAKAKAKIRPFSALDLDGISITGPDMPAAVTIGDVGIGIDMGDGGVPKDFTLKINEIVLPPELFAGEAQAKAVLDALGYSGFTVNVDLSGGYEHEKDTLTLRSFVIDTADVGKLDISGVFSGVPASKLAGGNDSTAMDDAKLDKLTLRFDNSGIVEKALDMQAKMMGVSRDDFVAQIAGALPLMLTAVGNQPFQDKVTAAAQAFLKDPKSITISLAPAEPVAFSQIMSIVGDQPQTLPDVLSVDVQANN